MAYPEDQLWVPMLDLIGRVAEAEYTDDKQQAFRNILMALRDVALRSRGCYRREHYSATQFMQVEIPASAWGSGRYDLLGGSLEAPRELFVIPETDDEEIINLQTVEVLREDCERFYRFLHQPKAPAQKTINAETRSRGRRPRARDAARRALAALYPEGVPNKPWKTLTAEVNDWLEAKQEIPVSEDSVRRAARRAETGK